MATRSNNRKTTQREASNMPTAKERSNLSAATRDAVFNTYELLEAIILALPGEDIFIAAHVCKAWHQLITTSSAVDKQIQATPFFMIERQQQEDEASEHTISSVTHLMLERCDVVIRRVPISESLASFESIALLRQLPLKANEKILIKFLKTDELVLGLTPNDYSILRWGWTAAFTRRLSCNYKKGLLRRLDDALSLRLVERTVECKQKEYSPRVSRDVARLEERIASWKAEGKLKLVDWICGNGFVR